MELSTRFIVDIYNLFDNNYVDIIVDKEKMELSAWIYNTNFDIKMFMFGQKYSTWDKLTEFKETVEANALDYLSLYLERVAESKSIMLKDFLLALGYGSKIVVVDADTDDEIFVTYNYARHCSLYNTEYANSSVVCIGNNVNIDKENNDPIYIFVRKER